jgi:hypothetical protein
MMQKQRETIFILMRDYHENPVPPELASLEAGSVILELDTIQEKITTMVFSLVRGEGQYFDWTPALTKLTASVKAIANTDTRSVLNQKIEQLLKIVEGVRAASVA